MAKHASAAASRFPGALDPSFGVDGKAWLESPSQATGFAVGTLNTASEKILALWEHRVPGTGGFARYRFGLARLTKDGVMDSGFANDGMTEGFNFGGDSEGLPMGFKQMADGRMLVYGHRGVIAKSPGGNSYLRQDAAVCCINGESIDSNFGVDGIYVLEGDNEHRNYMWRVVASDEYIFFISNSSDFSSNPPSRRFEVRRLDLQGRLDTSFQDQGVLHLNWEVADAVIHDNKIVCCGSGAADDEYFGVVARFNLDGSLDITFNGGGIKIIKETSLKVTFHAVCMDSSGVRILAAGYIEYAGRTTTAIVACLDTAGNLDPSFNSGRLFVYPQQPIPDNQFWWRAVKVQGDGKIVVVGKDPREGGPGERCLMGRIDPEGVWDISFGLGTGIIALNDVYPTEYGRGAEYLMISEDQSRILVSAFRGGLYGGGGFIAGYLAKGELQA